MTSRMLFEDSIVRVETRSGQPVDLLDGRPVGDEVAVYRVRIGGLLVRFDPAARSWYIELPGHDQAAGQIRTVPYRTWAASEPAINIDHDGERRVVGIEIL